MSHAPSLSELVQAAVSSFTTGDITGAFETAGRVLDLNPQFVAMHELRAICARGGRREVYIASLRSWHNSAPWLSQLYFELSAEYIISGLTEEASSWMDRGLSLAETDRDRRLPFGTVSYGRLLHDRQQLRYLIDKGVLDYERFSPVLQGYVELIANHYSQETSRDALIALDRSEVTNISPFYRRCLYIYPEKSVPILNPTIDIEHVIAQFIQRGVAVIDGLLTAEALGELQRYFSLSTVWHGDAQKGRTYLGAYQDTGGRSRILDALAAEVQETFAEILFQGESPQVWGYKNVYGDKALGVHADFANVNLNLWVTPDDRCIDASEGMIVYPKRAPSDWTFEDYNGNEERISTLLEGVEPFTIPYKANRGVFFESSLFHGSGRSRFFDDYESLRLNVTLLFGSR